MTRGESPRVLSRIVQKVGVLACPPNEGKPTELSRIVRLVVICFQIVVNGVLAFF